MLLSFSGQGSNSKVVSGMLSTKTHVAQFSYNRHGHTLRVSGADLSGSPWKKLPRALVLLCNVMLAQSC